MCPTYSRLLSNLISVMQSFMILWFDHINAFWCLVLTSILDMTWWSCLRFFGLMLEYQSFIRHKLFYPREWLHGLCISAGHVWQQWASSTIDWHSAVLVKKCLKMNLSRYCLAFSHASVVWYCFINFSVSGPSFQAISLPVNLLRHSKHTAAALLLREWLNVDYQCCWKNLCLLNLYLLI